MNALVVIMEEAVPLADLVAFLAAVGALLLTWRGWAGNLSRHLRLTAAGIAGLLFFHNTSNMLEWMRITAALDAYEDYSEMLFPLLYFLAAFIFVQERGVDELRQSEERHRKIYEVAGEGVLLADVETKRFHYANPAMCRMLGYTVEELCELGVMDIHPKADIGHVLNEFEAQACGEKELVFDIPCLRKDGTVFWADVSVGVAQLDRRRCNIGFFTDITDRKRSEEALREHEQQLTAANQQLRASEQQLRASNQQLTLREAQQEKLLKTLAAKNKELESIVYVASHDLRSPLVNIEGFGAELGKNCAQLTAILADSAMTGEKLQQVQSLIDTDIPECLNFISVSAEKMNALLDGLLRVCRVGTATIDIQRLDMKSVFNEIVETSRFKAKACGATITVENVPDCMGDETMVNQLFSNLVDNALKYLDPNRAGKIRIYGQTDGDASVYCVEDNGIGIAPAHVGKIFEVFHRLNPSDKAGGEGLGLTIVMRVLDRLNGSIRVDSEPGKGSRFRVTLPTVR